MRLPLLAIPLALALVLPGVAPAASTPAPGQPGGPGGPPKMISAWAYPAHPALLRKNPAMSAPEVGRVRFNTELGNAEVYAVSATVTGNDGKVWVRVDVPGRPNGRFGWVRADLLGSLHPIRQLLVISRGKLRATLFRSQTKKVLFSAPIGIGRAGTQTPRGDYYIREGTQIDGEGGAYGPFAFGTSAYSPGLSDWPLGGVIGIHGTNQPELIPGRVSHGCIRMRNADILRLRRLLDLGARVRIR
jgi:hypothetical protein